MLLTKKEEKILASINVPSLNNPIQPEFPPVNPHFPATSTYKIEVPDFNDVWLKDESGNPTGTHKDRMAWEMVVTYCDLLKAKKQGRIQKLPHLSIISSGSAANAIQNMLRAYGLPNLKVLIDYRLSANIKGHLKNINCELYEIDLSKKPLSTSEILYLTNNQGGIDITSDKSLDPNTRFYDWLSYEIVNQSPDYCFVPYGSGHLYENILNVNNKEVWSKKDKADPRFKGDKNRLANCHFIGATTNNPNSLADKLFSNHLPFTEFNENGLRICKNKGYCGYKSNVHVVEESYLQKAVDMANRLNITCEPSGIAGLGLLLQMKADVPRDKKIIIVNTGQTKIN